MGGEVSDNMSQFQNNIPEPQPFMSSSQIPKLGVQPQLSNNPLSQSMQKPPDKPRSPSPIQNLRDKAPPVLNPHLANSYTSGTKQEDNPTTPNFLAAKTPKFQI